MRQTNSQMLRRGRWVLTSLLEPTDIINYFHVYYVTVQMCTFAEIMKKKYVM